MRTFNPPYISMEMQFLHLVSTIVEVFMKNRFDRVCAFAETMVLQQDMAEDIDIYGILNKAQRETGEELEDPDFDAAVQWLDYFCADQGYVTGS
jgi:hypothetical protein